ncbi:MAG: phosphoadenylyl-sulfate reductase [Vulcanimicrobiaceae bacterium]
MATQLEPAEFDRIAGELDILGPEAILAWAVGAYHPRIVASCSFGGASGMVIVDMLQRLGGAVPIVYLDTDLLFDETYALVDRIAERYGIEPIAIRPAQTVAEQAATHGDALWARDPARCCGLRKVAPQREFLRGYDAWITGIRRDQSPARAATPVVQWDAQFGLAKINPLASWDEPMVWRYITEHGVPVNPLLARGYASIGCTPCTRPIAPGEPARTGRWSGFAKTECGLHFTDTES